MQFAQAAANAMVKRHPRRLSTWRSPHGAYRNQIDYFLVPRRWMSSVGKCRSYPSCDADTDHTLVGLKFGLKLKQCSRPHLAVRCNLSDRNERAKFQLKLCNRFGILDTPAASDPVNEVLEDLADRDWYNLRDTVLKAARETVKTKRRRPNHSWIKPETFALIEEKSECNRGGNRYKSLQKVVRKHLREDREEHLKTICGEMESAQRANNAKDMFRSMNRLTKQACPSVKLVQSDSGDIMTEDPQIMDLWSDYCEKLYSTTEQADTQTLTSGGLNEPIPTYAEVKKALKSLKSRKAAGPDEISAEMLKLGEESVTRALHRIIVNVWQTGKWSTDWTLVYLRPDLQEGRPTVCSTIVRFLISHASKVMLRVILDRMRDMVEYEVAEEQAGFRPQRGTHNHLSLIHI